MVYVLVWFNALFSSAHKLSQMRRRASPAETARGRRHEREVPHNPKRRPPRCTTAGEEEPVTVGHFQAQQFLSRSSPRASPPEDSDSEGEEETEKRSIAYDSDGEYMSIHVLIHLWDLEGSAPPAGPPKSSWV